MSSTIEGNIVSIIDRVTAVINIGRENGVNVGDKFVVYEIGGMVNDIDGKELEPLELLKRNVVVIYIQEKISVVESIDTRTVTQDPFSLMISRTQPIKLPLDDRLETRDVLPVKVGDRVKKI